MKATLRSTLAVVLLVAVLFACEKKHATGGQLISLADIIVNGAGADGSVQEIRKVMYTLKDLHKDQHYTLRTEIGLLPGGQTPDGMLTADIYASEAAFENNPDAFLERAVPFHASDPTISVNSNIYEVNFKAPSSGDYVVVISGASSSIPSIQFFYNLRIMSADPFAVPTVLTPFTTATIPASDAQQINPLNPGYLNIYNGGNITPSGVYSITLVSNATTTLANPQIFVYLDSTLTVSSLMLSSIPTTTEFVITSFNAGVPSSITEKPDTDVITGVTFTSSVDSSDQVGGPFIVLKGFVGAVTYTLSIQ